MAYITKVTGRLEKVIAGSRWFVNAYRLYYRQIVKREITLAGICRHDHILFIGGGALPCTAIEMAMVSGARVDVIDIDSQAVQTANKVVSHMGLSHRIQCFLASGQEVDVAGYTVIHIAMQAIPQDVILEHILLHARKDARILVRHPKKALKPLYSALSEKHQCQHCARVSQNTPTINATLMFTA